MLRRIFYDQLMQHSDFVNAVHDAAHLCDRCPRQSIRFVERLKPFLNFERLDIIRDLLAKHLGRH